MISLSRSRRLFVQLGTFFGLLAVALLSPPACDEHSCTGIGCLQGLSITFDDTFDRDRTFQLVLAHVGGSFMTCTLAPSMDAGGLGQTLSCTSTLPHVEQGKVLRLTDFGDSPITITASTGGTTVTTQTFTPVYKTAEINGPGCGTCTQAALTVSAS